MEMQTKEGKERLTRSIAIYEAHVAKRKAEEDHYIANKRTIVAAQSHARWAPTQSHGQMFREPFCDPNYLFKKDVRKATYSGMQTEPYRTTSKYGSQFSHTCGSII